MKTFQRFTFVATLAVGSFAGAVHAQVAPDVEALHRQGMALRDQHRDAEALAVFRQIYDSTHEPRAEARMALAEGALGQWVNAEVHLMAAMAVTQDAWVAANLETLQGVLAQVRGHLGNLDVTSTTPGAEVWLGGRRVAALPLQHPLRVEAGTVSLELRAVGYVPEIHSVVVVANGFAREAVTLTPEVAARTTVATVATVPVRHAMTFTDTPLLPALVSHGNSMRTWAWASAIGAGVFLGVGAVAYAVGDGAASTWNNDATCLVPGHGARSAQCSSQQSTASTMQPLAVTGLVVGGLLAVTSGVLFALPTGGGEHDSTHASFGCGAGPGALGMACGGTF